MLKHYLFLQDGVGYLFDCLTQNMGFSDGKPIAALTVYKCLLHWKCLEAERTPVLCRLIHIINSAIEVLIRNQFIEWNQLHFN